MKLGSMSDEGAVQNQVVLRRSQAKNLCIKYAPWMIFKVEI